MEMTIKDQFLHELSGKSKYVRTTGTERKNVGWGQRKLLLTEIQFFNLFWDKNLVEKPIVLYPGSAPGYHIPCLSEMYPQMEFHCYDPRSFAIKETDKIKLYSGEDGWFDDKKAEKWGDRSLNVPNSAEANGLDPGLNSNTTLAPSRIFFICDIRSDFRVGEDTEQDIEARVWRNNLQQQKWIETIRPIQSLVKFRLPYGNQWLKMSRERKWKEELSLPTYEANPALVRYLDGHIMLQPYTRATSSETRLVPVTNSEGGFLYRDWDILDYEDKLFYFNRITKDEMSFLNPFTKTLDPIDGPELLNDFDSVYEASIISNYIEKHGEVPTQELVSTISRFITTSINKTGEETALITLSSLRESKTTFAVANKAQKVSTEAPVPRRRATMNARRS